ncbi:MAG TPA: capsular biosynthesis protein [Cytophagales bacterium]|nr:capsular biosynthesis protein [Cytophagales bacterium]HRG08756.1 CapA family protein [Cyclobacteriaceae bacterium]
MNKFVLTFFTLVISVCSHGQDTTRLSLLFTGDIMQHDSNIATAFDPVSKRYDYSACFEYVAPIVRTADLAIGNLELTLAGSPYKGYPQFSAPDALAVELKRIGFDVLVTANNHSVDRRKKGVERTIRVLDSLQILHTGTFVDSAARANTYPLIVEKNGFKLSLLNYTYGTNGIPITKPNIVNLIDTVQIKLDMAQAREQKTDAIIVFMHWGDEYQSLPNSTQKKLAKLLFREGAKLVIGAHPHVLQPMEWNKERDQLIVYSLGNFVSGQRPRYRDGGAMLWVELQKVIKDSVTQTSIHNSEYELEWVQKSTEFVMRPLRYFEGDTVFVKDKVSRDAMQLFAKDSRALLTKHNVQIAERKFTQAADSTEYAIYLGIFDEADTLVNSNELLKFYGLTQVSDEQGKVNCYVGKFYDAEIARQVLTEIHALPVFRRARMIRRVQ